MTQSDRDLLERAARTAGYTVHGWINDRFYVADPRSMCNFDPFVWNPLTDDGDALRLAVKLRIDLDFDSMNPLVEAYHKTLEGADQCHTEALPPDPYAAARRAVVRAAAALDAEGRGREGE